MVPAWTTGIQALGDPPWGRFENEARSSAQPSLSPALCLAAEGETPMSMPAPQLNRHARSLNGVPQGGNRDTEPHFSPCVSLPPSNARGCPLPTESTLSFLSLCFHPDHPIRILKSALFKEDKHSFLFVFFNNKEVSETAEPRAHLELSPPVDLTFLFRFPTRLPTGKRPRTQIPGWLVWTMTCGDFRPRFSLSPRRTQFLLSLT